MLALSGGVVSTIVMAILWRHLGRRGITGLVGTGITGALLHNAGQLIAVYFLMARNIHLFYQIPLMIAASVIFGTMVSLLVIPLLTMTAGPFPSSSNIDISGLQKHPSGLDCLLSSIAFGFCIVLIFVNNTIALIAAAAMVTLIVQFIEHGSWMAFFRPLQRFWLLFIAVAALHLFFSYGKKIEQAPFLTYEGVSEAIKQTLRLWAWLQTASLFKSFKFHLVFMELMRKFFRNHDDTLYAGLLALEVFPSLTDILRKRAAGELRTAFTNPVRWARNAVELTLKDIAAAVTGK
jgi:hypothetical protein